MSARWSELTAYLRGRTDQVTVSWRELDRIVGGLPDSARKHPAWWAGDRAHVRAWKAAGFEVADKMPGEWVCFAPTTGAAAEACRDTEVEVNAPASSPSTSDVILVTCVKTKLTAPAAAKDLYVSPMFRMSRRFAEASGRPWFILSAEHGLVVPDDWLAPYERYLPETSQSYRRAWGEWVAARLELLLGDLGGKVVEIHASREYVEAARPGLEGRGAVVLLPLHGLSQGERLSWYRRWEEGSGNHMPVQAAERSRVTTEDPLVWNNRLSCADDAITPAELLGSSRRALGRPGLYSWWVDERGAEDLSRGLGQPVASGLIYAGQAGATRWPSGRRSTNTLWSRLVGMHLGKKAEFSTFRLTLGGILRESRRWQTIDEPALTAWMHEHLRVLPLVHADADSLGDLEDEVLAILDPPLNLKGMPTTELRSRLTDLRGSAKGK